MKLVLCSASPRRREFLERLGVRFEVAPAHIDETQEEGEAARPYAIRMALEKSAAGACPVRLRGPGWEARRTIGLGARTMISGRTFCACNGSQIPNNIKPAKPICPNDPNRPNRPNRRLMKPIPVMLYYNITSCIDRLSMGEPGMPLAPLRETKNDRRG